MSFGCTVMRFVWIAHSCMPSAAVQALLLMTYCLECIGTAGLEEVDCSAHRLLPIDLHDDFVQRMGPSSSSSGRSGYECEFSAQTNNGDGDGTVVCICKVLARHVRDSYSEASRSVAVGCHALVDMKSGTFLLCMCLPLWWAHRFVIPAGAL